LDSAFAFARFFRQNCRGFALVIKLEHVSISLLQPALSMFSSLVQWSQLFGKLLQEASLKRSWVLASCQFWMP
jgi:hypothetical protein